MALLTLAYSTQFQFSFLEGYPEKTGTVAQRQRVSFRRLNYSGEIVEVLPRGEPTSRAFEDNSDSRFVSILPSKLEIALACQEYWQAESFYVDTDRELQVIVELDTTGTGNNYVVDWLGWVLPQDLKEAFEAKPYPVSVSAACGLSTLKSRPLLDRSGTRLTGSQAISTVIKTALDLTDHDAAMITAMNLFDRQSMADKSGGLALPERDPLNRVHQNAAGLATDKNEALSAYDTLKKDLEPFGLRVAMVQGVWQLIRADEAAGGWDPYDGSGSTIHTRTYPLPNPNDPPLNHGSVDLNVYVGPGHPNVVLSGGMTWLENSKPGVRVEQKFGAYLDKLGNGAFAQVDGTGLPIGWNRKNSDENRVKRIGAGTDTDPYRVKIIGVGYDGYIEDQVQGLYQQLHYDTESLAIDRNKKITRTLKFRFRLYNAKGAVVVVRASTEAGHWWILAEGGTWIKDPKKADRKGIVYYNFVLANNIETPKPGWSSVSLTIPPVDYNPTQGVGINEFNIFFSKPYALEVHDTDGKILGPVTTPEGYIEIADVELVEEDTSVKLDGTQRTIVRKDKIAETVLSMTLGDVPDAAKPYDRENTLLDINGVATTLWHRPNANILSPNPTGKDVGLSLIDWNVDSRARQDMRAAKTFEGTIYGRLPMSIHNVLRFVGVGEENEDGLFVMYPFQITRLTSRFRSMEHDITAVRMMNTVPVPTLNVTTLKEWQSGSDVFPIENDLTTGEPIGPTLPVVFPPDVSIKKVIGSLGLLPGLGLATNAPALYVPADVNDPQFTATGRVNGVVVGRTISSLRRTTLFQIPP